MTETSRIESEIRRPEPEELLEPGEALIVVPPFAAADRPSLAAHLLQACSREAGFETRVLYAGLHFASLIGEQNYKAICLASPYALLGERFFSAAAYGGPPLGREPERMLDVTLIAGRSDVIDYKLGAPGRLRLELPELYRLEELAAPWVDAVAEAVVAAGYRVVGCSTTFEQTAASIALLGAVKRRRPEVVTILGGANCDGEMAEGIVSLGVDGRVDYVAAGESETLFPRLLRALAAGEPPAPGILRGEPCSDLDAIPTPRYQEFYHQLQLCLPASERKAEVWLSYETSRGCWWGQKSHCTFCGLNAQSIRFREKSPDRVLSELEQLLPEHPNRKVFAVDNIMPHSYFRTLVPRLADRLPDLHMFYEQKANLSLDNLEALARAGVAQIQPGVEALSSGLLKRMGKGVLVRQNIALLRYARAVDIAVGWNLLWGFPGERVQDYEETLALVPLIHHLPPPTGLSHLSIERFSPYFDHPEEHGLTNVRPIGNYAALLPAEAEVEKIAYHFVADYESAAHDNMPLMERIAEELALWQGCWKTGVGASLQLNRMSDTMFLLQDTRGLDDLPHSRVLDRRQAALCLIARPLVPTPEVEWAVANKLAVVLDNWYVPLATARPQLIRELEQEARFGSRRLEEETSRPGFVKAEEFVDARSAVDSQPW